MLFYMYKENFSMTTLKLRSLNKQTFACNFIKFTFFVEDLGKVSEELVQPHFRCCRTLQVQGLVSMLLGSFGQSPKLRPMERPL